MAGLLAACQGPSAPANSSFVQLTNPGDPAPWDSTGEASSGAPESTGTPPESSSTGDPSSTSGTTAPLLDVGGSSDLGDLQPAGCKGKIDFLFVISGEGNMQYHQEQLIDAFPKFIATIESKFADFDYHIMVVDADQYWRALGCEKEVCVSECQFPDYPCDKLDLVTECDETWGAGSVFPIGYMASNKSCPIAGGRRYMTKDQPDLSGTFACVARQGGSGYNLVGQSLAKAMNPALNAPGGCNEGFLRDDALLMVTMIAGSYDYFSADSPKVWAKAVLDAKHGDSRAVVMLEIVDAACPPPDRVCDLHYHFPYFLSFDVVATDLGPAFEQATDMLGSACSEFIPQ